MCNDRGGTFGWGRPNGALLAIGQITSDRGQRGARGCGYAGSPMCAGIFDLAQPCHRWRRLKTGKMIFFHLKGFDVWRLLTNSRCYGQAGLWEKR